MSDKSKIYYRGMPSEIYTSDKSEIYQNAKILDKSEYKSEYKVAAGSTHHQSGRSAPTLDPLRSVLI